MGGVIILYTKGVVTLTISIKNIDYRTYIIFFHVLTHVPFHHGCPFPRFLHFAPSRPPLRRVPFLGSGLALHAGPRLHTSQAPRAVGTMRRKNTSQTCVEARNRGHPPLFGFCDWEPEPDIYRIWFQIAGNSAVGRMERKLASAA